VLADTAEHDARARTRSRAGLLGLALICGCAPLPSEVPAARVVATVPRDGEMGVDRRARIEVRWERPVLPRSIRGASVDVWSGERFSSRTVRADPVGSGIVVTLGTTLEPRARYHLRVSGMRDLDARAMEGAEIVFHTGDAATTPVPDPVPPWSEIGPLLAARCAGCHGGPRPALGLDLASAEGVRATAIGRASTEAGPLPSATASGIVGGLGGAFRIAALGGVGRPEDSFLVYKILGDPHAGERMPPEVDAGSGPLSQGEIRRISDWILGGAPTE
jgi:hypothetical protein